MEIAEASDPVHQKFEKNWWGDCANTFGEEAKQITYAHRMGLVIANSNSGKWPVYDLEGKSVLDIGGGPVSMLLKTVGTSKRTVIDPCDYPQWVKDRYHYAGIEYFQEAAEDWPDLNDYIYDEVWIYNVLQHVVYPEKIIQNAKDSSKAIRIFEWVDTPASLGHPYTLTESNLNKWIGSRDSGVVEDINENGAVGKCYYGVFQ